MDKIERRNEIRIDNQIEIINLLRRGKRTTTELAKRLGVSFTAISNIVDELVKSNLIKYSNKKEVKSRGRNPVFVELNCDDGVVCSIDLSSYFIKVVIASLDSHIIVEEIIPDFVFLTNEHLEQIEQCIKKLLEAPEVNNRKLLSICIASPGLIRPDTYEYVHSRRLAGRSTINPVAYFANAFNVKVEMHNDVRIGCLAELKYGVFPKTPFNGLFIHIGFYSSLTLVLNGKIYEGSNGYAGEIPVYDLDEKDANIWNSRFCPIFEIARTIQNQKGLPLSLVNDYLDLNKIIEDYKNGDPITVKAVQDSAKINAMTIYALATILDIDYVVIEGKILEFGEDYLDLVKQYSRKVFSSTIAIRARILASSLKEESAMIGACHQAATMYFLSSIEGATKERIDLPDFVIDKKYREI